MEEAPSREAAAPLGSAQNPAELLAPPQQDGGGVFRRLSLGRRNAIKRMSRSSASGMPAEEEDELDPELVDILDVVGESQFLFLEQYRTR